MEVKVFKKLKRHWIAALIAVIFGFLIIWPFLHFQLSLDDEYKGILSEIANDELFYLARIKDVMDGHQTLGNAYLYEHKGQLPQQLFLPEWLLAQPLKSLNLDIVQGRIFYSFFLPAIAFFLTYAAFYLIYPSKLWTNLAAIFLFFGLYVFNFLRPVIPQFIFIFWLTQFIFLWELAKNPLKRKFQILSVLNFGLLFYIYPFYWTFYFVFLAGLAFIFFFKDRLVSKRFLAVLVGGLVIGSAYFYLTFLASRLPEYQETLTRLQLVLSHSPSEVKSVVLSLLFLALVWVLYRFKKIKLEKEILFFIAGAFSILIVTNQNIITGYKLEFGHYRMLAVFFLTFGFYYLWSLTKRKFKLLIASLMLIVAVSGSIKYLKTFSNLSEDGYRTRRYSIVFDWLNKNAPYDSVVYANEEISNLIPVHTSNNVFYSRNANLFIISDSEVLERFVLNNFFEEFDRGFVVENERAIWGVRHVDRYGDAVQANKWRGLFGFELKDETRLPEEEISKVLSMAGEVKKDSFEKRLKKYKVDYFVWDRISNPEWKLEELRFLKKSFDKDEFFIYKVR